SAGTLFISLTMTLKLPVSLSGGVPLSVTLTVIINAPGPWASVGVQLSTPVCESRVTPVGADTRLKVSVLGGRSGSVALFVTTSVLSSLIVRSACAGNTGSLFTSVTVTVKILVAWSAGVPLSVTIVLNVFTLGPCASVGVQVITPLPLILAPAGGDTN